MIRYTDNIYDAFDIIDSFYIVTNSVKCSLIVYINAFMVVFDIQ